MTPVPSPDRARVRSNFSKIARTWTWCWRTIADGLRTSLGELTFAIISKDVDDIVTVTEESIVRAMRLAWEVLKVIIEPSSAVALAALTEKRLPGVDGKRVGVIVSGGNADLDQLPWTKQSP
jgi:threonine dehydratase